MQKHWKQQHFKSFENHFPFLHFEKLNCVYASLSLRQRLFEHNGTRNDNIFSYSNNKNTFANGILSWASHERKKISRSFTYTECGLSFWVHDMTLPAHFDDWILFAFVMVRQIYSVCKIALQQHSSNSFAIWLWIFQMFAIICMQTNYLSDTLNHPNQLERWYCLCIFAKCRSIPFCIWNSFRFEMRARKIALNDSGMDRNAFSYTV